MLKIASALRDLDYPQLLNVYREQLSKNTSFDAARTFYEDLSLFLSVRDNVCCLWVQNGRYTACVRVEPYLDGVLMTCLETAPDCRRQGFAFELVTGVLRYLSQQGCKCAYVHVEKKNHASMQLHKKAGFCTISDSARLIDGTVSQNYFTLAKKL